METILFFAFLALPDVINRLDDPMWGGEEAVRNMECREYTHAEGHRLFPGQVPPTPARSIPDSLDVQVMVCTPRMMNWGERKERDELLLSGLSTSVNDIVQEATALYGADTRWQVDAYLPGLRVASKVAVAARTTLAERGAKVSDRVPVLAAGDIALLGRLPVHQAYKAACQRYASLKVMGDNDAFLGLMLVDAQEAQLHAGVCARGEWRWLR